MWEVPTAVASHKLHVGERWTPLSSPMREQGWMFGMNRARGLVALILLNSLIVACAAPSPSGDKAATQRLTVKAADTLKFDPSTITVKQGTPVRLTLENSGVLEHNWVVDSLDGQQVEAHAKPNSTAAVEFTPSAPARYEFYCSIPGHREAGMTGTLIVQ